MVDGRLALAAQCEAAAVGSFYLNKAILQALGYTWRGMGYWFRDDSHQWKGSTQFTQSIDAALTLVPEKFSTQMWLSLRCNEGKTHPPKVAIWSHNDGHLVRSRFNLEVTAATPALALCAAALRARTDQPPESSL